MERAVHDLDLHVDYLVTRKHAALDGLLDAIDDGRDVFLRDGAADDFVFDLDALALFVGLNLDAGVPVLAATAGLADEFAFAVRPLGDGFAVGDLRRAGIGLDFEFTEQAVANDFQVQLAHAGDDELSGFLVGETPECRVFLGQALQAFAHFFTVRLRLRFDGHRDDRFGEGGRFERDLEILVAKGVAGRDIPQSDERGDVTGKHGLDVDAFVRLNHHHAADALAFARARVVNDVAFFQLAAVGAEENELADVGVGPEFERQRAELGAVVGRNLDLVFGVPGLFADGGRHIER